MLQPLLLTENYPPDRGGMAQSCDRIVRALRAAGVAVDVAHFGARVAGVTVEQQARGRLIGCEHDADPSHAINLLWSAVDALRPKPTHVVAFGGVLPILAAPVFAAWLDVPLVALLRGNDFDTGIVSLRRGWALREALARAARVCVVSRDHERKVARLFPETPVRFVANGIDAAPWAPLPIDRERAAAWRAAHVAPGRRVLGLFGHLKRKKGGVFFLDALLRSGHAGRFHPLIVGDVEPEMLARLEALPAALTWTHVPFVDRFELLPWYAACELVAVPSLYDGMPNVVLEAGAVGVGVLGSDAGGLADLIVDGDNALVFRAGDPHDCRRALDLAATLPLERLHALGERLHSRVVAEFDARTEAARYRDVLLETVAAAAPRAAHAPPIPTGELR